MRPWSRIPIEENREPLRPLPADLLRLEPHPYRSLGAPYGVGGDPFRLRAGVVDRLLEAQVALQRLWPEGRLAIFDGWRPLAVQRFMVAHAIGAECRARGVDPTLGGPALRSVEQEVGRFWAPPSDDPATPPPHSTGAAVDLTLADAHGHPVEMGGAIDAIGAISEPEHHAAAAAADPQGPAALWHQRRTLLGEAMASAGFARHPNEWWHFSYGDQLWAWIRGEATAIYGRVPEAAGAGALGADVPCGGAAGDDTPGAAAADSPS